MCAAWGGRPFPAAPSPGRRYEWSDSGDGLNVLGTRKERPSSWQPGCLSCYFSFAFHRSTSPARTTIFDSISEPPFRIPFPSTTLPLRPLRFSLFSGLDLAAVHHDEGAQVSLYGDERSLERGRSFLFTILPILGARLTHDYEPTYLLVIRKGGGLLARVAGDRGAADS